MKRILIALILLPLSSFAMENTEGFPIAISLARDGEGATQSIACSKGEEVSAKFSMLSRDFSKHYQYIVTIALHKVEKGQATIVGSIERRQVIVEKSIRALEQIKKIERITMPLNERNVMNFQYIGDIEKVDGAMVDCPLTLGLIVLDLANPPKAKL